MDDFSIDHHKLYWHLDRLVDQRRGLRVAPLYMEISPVSYCNHACHFCGKDFAQSQGHKLDPHRFQNFVDGAGRLGLKSIMFAGEGEPLLHPSFIELVESTKQAGIDLSVTTNGVHMKDQVCSSLIRQATWVRFSVNAASPASYAKVHRCREQDFKTVIANIEAAVEEKKRQESKCTLGVQLVVLQENQDELLDYIDLFMPMGLDYISLKPFSRNPQMISTTDEKYSIPTLERIQEIQARYSHPSGQTKVLCRLKAFQGQVEQEIKTKRCHALPFWAYMMANGDFYTCPIHIGNPKFRVGNFNEQTVEELLLGDQRQRSIDYAKNELDVPSQCRINCRMARVNEFIQKIESPPEHVNFI